MRNCSLIRVSREGLVDTVCLTIGYFHHFALACRELNTKYRARQMFTGKWHSFSLLFNFLAPLSLYLLPPHPALVLNSLSLECFSVNTFHIFFKHVGKHINILMPLVKTNGHLWWWWWWCILKWKKKLLWDFSKNHMLNLSAPAFGLHVHPDSSSWESSVNMKCAPVGCGHLSFCYQKGKRDSNSESWWLFACVCIAWIKFFILV